MEMLQLNDLHKTFNPGTVNEKVALNGVSLHMEAGDFATIVGSNGAGKSTLFNAITGGFIADEGSILLGGQDITFAPEHQRSKVIGHLFQDPLKGTAHVTLVILVVSASILQLSCASVLMVWTRSSVTLSRVCCQRVLSVAL